MGYNFNLYPAYFGLALYARSCTPPPRFFALVWSRCCTFYRRPPASAGESWKPRLSWRFRFHRLKCQRANTQKYIFALHGPSPLDERAATSGPSSRRGFGPVVVILLPNSFLYPRSRAGNPLFAEWEVIHTGGLSPDADGRLFPPLSFWLFMNRIGITHCRLLANQPFFLPTRKTFHSAWRDRSCTQPAMQPVPSKRRRRIPVSHER